MKLKWLPLAVLASAAAAVLAWPPTTRSPARAAPPAPAPSIVGPLLSETGMEGLTAIDVRVEPLTPEWARAVGLSEAEIDAQVRAYLRRVPGLKLVKSTSFAEPVICVTIDGLLDESGASAAAVRLELTQSALLGRPSPGGRDIIAVGAATWDAAEVLTDPADTAQGRHITEKLTSLLDRFRRDYLNANLHLAP